MKQIHLDSPEFNRVLKNMQLEVFYLGLPSGKYGFTTLSPFSR